MSRKNSIITYALVGLAAGTAVWLLVGTKEGRHQLDCANKEIKRLSKIVRKKAKKGMDTANQFAQSATREAQDLTSKAKSMGKKAVSNLDDSAREAEKLAKETVSDLNKSANSARSAVENSARNIADAGSKA